MRRCLSCCSCLRPRALLAAGLTIVLSGCWIPPAASIRPAGKPRVVADGIVIERVLESATVAGVDQAARTLALRAPGIPLLTCAIGGNVLDAGAVRIGDPVRARIRETLTVYVAPPAGSSGAGTGPQMPAAAARVLTVDPSYRVLTVSYASGATEAFKIGLHSRMEHIEAGDSVAFRAAEVTELRVRRH